MPGACVVEGDSEILCKDAEKGTERQHLRFIRKKSGIWGAGSSGWVLWLTDEPIGLRVSGLRFRDKPGFQNRKGEAVVEKEDGSCDRFPGQFAQAFKMRVQRLRL